MESFSSVLNILLEDETYSKVVEHGISWGVIQHCEALYIYNNAFVDERFQFVIQLYGEVLNKFWFIYTGTLTAVLKAIISFHIIVKQL